MCFSVWLGTCFDEYKHLITLSIDKEIEICFSDISVRVCSDGKLEGLVKGFQYGI